MKSNFLVIGSGIAGLNFALHAAHKGDVIVVTKKKLIDSSTNFAQGGIAAVIAKTDNAQLHIEDTMKAGAFLNKKKAVRFMVNNSRDAIHRLVELGVKFEKEHGKLKLTQEGGHSHRRIAYVGDYTGNEIEQILIKRIKEHPNIKILENTFALDLIVHRKKCYGAQIIKGNKIKNIFADQTIIATGGAGQIFENTTNPEIATGDGIAMAVRKGCKTKNMEFIQFHPTALAKKTTPRFLISETVRGEGAKLENSKGKKFMKGIHPLADLAPRDIVAREIFKELKSGPVFLNIKRKSAKTLKKRFPKIYEKLRTYKIDMSKDLIPITPAAHYLCGGVITDLNGRTNIKNLFAFGEVTYTGVHGANRLASNSLLEALVFSNQILKKLKKQQLPANIKITKPRFLKHNSPKTKLANKLRKEIQEIMWEHAGILRNRKDIKKRAIPRIKRIIKKLNSIKSTNVNIAETKNMAQVGLIILKSAYKRRKSIGGHFVL
ncbi:L-aspartate oxidase [Patescibacteria group bacterium]